MATVPSPGSNQVHADHLVWIDLEMTGLDPDTDAIIEIATLVTDANLQVLAEGPELAVRHRERGVVGFDIAGPEAGYRPTRHLEAFDKIRHENFHITIHAGEGFGAAIQKSSRTA